MTEHILSSQAGRGAKKARQLLQDGGQIKVAKFSAINRVRWSRSIKRHSKQIFRKTQDPAKKRSEDGGPEVCEGDSGESKFPKKLKHGDDEAAPQVKPQTPKHVAPMSNTESEEARFRCPHCEHNVKASRPAFSLTNLGAKTWCNQCRKAWQVKSWLCSCGELWYRCNSHKNVAGVEAEKDNSDQLEVRPLPKPRRKRKPPQSLEDLESLSQEEVSKRRVKGSNCSTAWVIRKGMLSANLKRKFAHLIEN